MLLALLMAVLLCIAFPFLVAKAIWVTTPLGLVLFAIFLLLLIER